MSEHVVVLLSDAVDTITVQNQTRFLCLPHPRTGVASLFLPYSKDADRERRASILEVQSVAPPNARSWFLDDKQVIEDGKLLLLTPMDPVFLLIPLLQAAYPNSEQSGIFRPADDIFEQAISNLSKRTQSTACKDPSTIASSKDLLTFTSLDFIPRAMMHICEVKNVTSEITVYKYSIPRLIDYLRDKVRKLVASEVFKCSRTLVRNLAKDGLMEDGKEDLLSAGQTKTACDIISQHLPSDIRTALLATYDFAELDLYLKSLHDEFTIPKATDTDKIKKKPVIVTGNDNKKRKANASHGVEKLKKVNVDGMSKISSFFQKPK